MRVIGPPKKSRHSDRDKRHAGIRRFADRVRVRKHATADLPQSENSALYRQFTPAYELLFPLLVRKRIWSAIRQLNLRPGTRTLEVGVGTGTSLQAYPHDVQVTGIDLSQEMLAVAKRKIAEENWNHIQVQQGNAEKLEFDDASFDCVTSFHTVSVVSNPESMMREIARVVRPGGKVLVINHFRSPRPWLANMIDRADPVTRHLGWRTDLECEAVVRSLPLEVDKRYKTSPLSLFTVVRATRLPDHEV
jgi:phosphatidylethanolamine/phosphatidyl-N-methylethanolamine N-methyltransferase